MLNIIKKLAIKFWNWVKGRDRLRKIATTADFHKRCEYYQEDIERLFKDGFFDLKGGSIEYNRDWEGKIRGKAKIITYV